MLIRKVQLQLQPQQGWAKRIFKLGLRMNYMIAMILSLKNYLISKGEEEEGYVPLDNIEDNYVEIEEESNN